MVQTRKWKYILNEYFAISLATRWGLIESQTATERRVPWSFESLIYIHAVGRPAAIRSRISAAHALDGPELKLTRAIFFFLFHFFDGLCAIKFV